jgi:DNA/RNA endonuclease YhcR with UshA esterase domain
VFTTTIFKARQPYFTGVKGYEGKVAQVRGLVRLYRGKPETVLEDPGQPTAPD